MKKSKKRFLVFFTLVMTAVTAAAITYALRDNASFEQKDNTFTNGEIAVELIEENWDQKKSGVYFPGSSISKQPLVHYITDPDTSGSEFSTRVWAGVKAEYVLTVENVDGTTSTYRYTGEQFNKSIAYFSASSSTNRVEGINGNWAANDDYTQFYYKSQLYNNSNTSPIFNFVVVRNGPYSKDGTSYGEEYVITLDQDSGMYKIPVYGAADATEPTAGNKPTGKVESYSLPDFDIKLKVYALQVSKENENYNTDGIRDKLSELMNDGTTAPIN